MDAHQHDSIKQDPHKESILACITLAQKSLPGPEDSCLTAMTPSLTLSDITKTGRNNISSTMLNHLPYDLDGQADSIHLKACAVNSRVTAEP